MTRALLRSLGQLLLITLLSLLLFEGVLQAASLVFRSSQERAPADFSKGDFRVLCLGDSNTYGVLLPQRSDAYPAQLEAAWNAAGIGQPIEVLNAGYPGTSSSMLLRNLPGYLSAFAPQVTIVLVGANDYWTAPVTTEAQTDGFSPWRFVQEHSRVHRLFYMAWAALTEPNVEASFHDDSSLTKGSGSLRYAGREFPVEYVRDPQPVREARKGLVRNLGAIVAAIREAGAAPILLTYPADRSNYARANQQLRRVARERGVVLFDLEPVFNAACPDDACTDLFLPDRHPTAEGHGLAARTIAAELRRRGIQSATIP
jgi:lysophospholipase L1-like esterase